jgi:UDP-N-acetylglucosamine--N-acetylmuramyl-(pentapeptide) pyrophosphoryl-undecaprenol N-acetylglucosamine transferase
MLVSSRHSVAASAGAPAATGEAAPVYIFAGGGTGGHLYPGIAVAERLVEIDPAAKIVFACSDRAIDRHILSRTPYAFVPQPVRPLPRRVSHVPGFLRAWIASKRLARVLLNDLKPRALLGLGGFAAGAVMAAGAGKVRAALLNPDAVPGKANRFLARKVQAIFTQFESTSACFAGNLVARVRRVGCPVRGRLTGGSAAEARELFALDAGRPTLLVLGGSTGAASINAAMVAVAGRLAADARAWQVLHLAGVNDEAALRSAYADAGVRARVMPYCDRMELAYALADLAVCRGGASTVAELGATGTPAIIVPYPHHRDRQQSLNAQAMQRSGAAVCVEEDATDPARNAESLAADLVPILADPDRLERMKLAADRSDADAASAVAEWLAG